MGSYLTFEELNKAENAYEVLNKLNEFFLAHSENQRTFVFLSHRHSENEKLIRQVRGFFASMGASLYIDWLDTDMPAVTSGETAAKLKQKINISDKFVVLATPDSIESIWMPWEIGLADQIKGLENIAILPVIFENKTWDRREYYQLYSTIEKIGSKWYVLEPGKYYGPELKEWLKVK